MTTPRYDCSKCPAYCCTYPRTPVTEADVRRLAKGLGKPVAVVRDKHTKVVDGERVLRHKQDEIFDTCCNFLDKETRQCTVYKHRPHICRSFPGHGQVRVLRLPHVRAPRSGRP